MRGTYGGRLSLALTTLFGLGLTGTLTAGEPPEVARTDGASELTFAVEPKPLSDQVKKGLGYLVKNQKDNGGWGQGGGWRTDLKGSGRIEGDDVEDPADVGNTCIALLALIRAGNSPTEGPHAENVTRGLNYLLSKVEQADEKSLEVTDIKGTQLQSKIGPYIDTFLAAMVMAEVKGKTADEKAEARLMAAAKKTLGKMERHQQKDGTFAGNTGWATVLSQGVANKAFNFAAQNGIMVGDETIRRVERQVAQNFDAEAGEFRTSGAGGGAFAGRAAGTGPAPAGELGGAGGVAAPTSDAGVALYSASSNLTNAADVLRSYRVKEEKARQTLERDDATPEERKKARQDIKDAERVEGLNQAATEAVLKQVQQPGFVEGFGSNGGEEFLSFMNISETLLLKGGDEWKAWDQRMTKSIERAQNGDGSWSGHHCITGKTFCTSAALLVLMSDRARFPVEALKEARAVQPKPEE